jgi:serine protease inhibitor
MKWFILMTTASILALFCNNISATNHHERVKRTQIQSSFVTKLRETPFRLSAGMNTFSHGLFDVLSEKNDGNIIFSPFSLHTALSMVLIGAPNGTRTFKELGTALSIELEHSEDYLYNYLRLLQYYETLQGNSDTKIKFANKAFADDSLKPKANYLTILELFYRYNSKQKSPSIQGRHLCDVLWTSTIFTYCKLLI